MTAAAQATQVSAEDRLRADLYNYLGVMLARPADQMLLDQTAGLSGDDSPLGEAINGLARVAKAMTPKKVQTEFNALFIGLGRGELLPYASYYLTGFLNEKPLASLRSDMAVQRISRAENVFEPEDNIASLMEMMGGMIVGRFGAPASDATQRAFSTNTSRLGRVTSLPTCKGPRTPSYMPGLPQSAAPSWTLNAKHFV